MPFSCISQQGCPTLVHLLHSILAGVHLETCRVVRHFDTYMAPGILYTSGRKVACDGPGPKLHGLGHG